MNGPPLPPEARPRLAAKVRLQTDRLTGKPILLFPEGALILNPTGAAIVGLCDGQKTFSEITQELGRVYQALPEALADDAAAYLHRLRERSLMLWEAERPETSQTFAVEAGGMESADIGCPQ